MARVTILEDAIFTGVDERWRCLSCLLAQHLKGCSLTNLHIFSAILFNPMREYDEYGTSNSSNMILPALHACISSNPQRAPSQGTEPVHIHYIEYQGCVWTRLECPRKGTDSQQSFIWSTKALSTPMLETIIRYLHFQR